MSEAHPAGCAALRIVLVSAPRASRYCEHFSDGFDIHLLRAAPGMNLTRRGLNFFLIEVAPSPVPVANPLYVSRDFIVRESRPSCKWVATSM